MFQSGPRPSLWKSRPIYARVAIVGFLLVGLASVLILIPGIIDENEALWATGLLGVMVSLAFAGVLLKIRGWTLIVSAILGLGALVIYSGHIFDYGLSNPDSFFDFVPGLLALFGSLMALGGSIAAYIHGRRPSPRTHALGVEVGAFWAIGLILLAGTVASGVLTVSSRSTVSAEEALGAIVLDMDKIQFEPDSLEIPAERGVRLLLNNKDLVYHTFSIKGLDINHGVVGRNERLIQLPALRPGTYEYTCEVPGHEDMKGTLIVSQ